jgi:rhodanese-related sulfurtransferase
MRRAIYRKHFRILSYVALGLITLSVLAIGLTIWGLRSDAIEDAQTDTTNIATVLSEQLARSIQSIDIVLTDVREQTEAQSGSVQNEFDRRIRSHDFYQVLKERLSHLSQADFIAILDKGGQVAVTTQQWPTPKMDLADRNYFQHFKDKNDSGIYITGLLSSRVTGARTIFLANESTVQITTFSVWF